MTHEIISKKTVDSKVLSDMYSRKDERGCRTSGGEGAGVPEIVSKDLIEEVDIVVDLEGQLRNL